MDKRLLCIFSCAVLISCGGQIPDVDLTSTSSLENAGADAEIPTLVPRVAVDKSLEHAVGLSPDGSELAVVVSNELALGYETVVSIYDTRSGFKVREFTESFEEYGFAKWMGGGFSRPELVMWSEDNTLTVLYGSEFVGYSFDALTGELFAKATNTDDFLCSAIDEDYGDFNARTNTFYCIGYDSNATLVTINTRTLNYSVEYYPQGSQSLADVILSYDGGELALRYGSLFCSWNCNVSSVAYIDPKTKQPTRDVVDFSTSATPDESSATEYVRFLGLAGRIADSEDFYIHGFSYNDDVVALDLGDRFRVATVPDGRIVGDIIGRGSSYPELLLLSLNGRIAAHVSNNLVEIYDISAETIYTVLESLK